MKKRTQAVAASVPLPCNRDLIGEMQIVERGMKITALRDIPNVGKETEKTLNELGYHTPDDIKDVPPEELYARECAMKGCEVDRCQLYLYRAVHYILNTEDPDPDKVKWWRWKDGADKIR